MKLIVGLGNPGKRYEKTRHNAGFLLLDELQHTYNTSTWSLSKKFNAKISEGIIAEQNILLVKPMTFMNNSGQAVGLLSTYYNIPPSDILVIHDDKDITLGTLKIQTNRGAAGHNGVKSIIAHLGTQDFTRLRLGIAPEEQTRMADMSTFVLGKFGLFEKRAIKKMAHDAKHHIEQWLA